MIAESMLTAELPRTPDLAGGCIGEILKERRGITPDTALRLAKYFGTDAQSWMNLQTSYDLKIAIRQRGKEIERDIQPMTAAG